MSHEVSGTLLEVFDEEQVTKNFRKQEFILEVGANTKYPQTVIFELTGKNIGALAEIEDGSEITVSFSLRGRRWDGPKGTRYFNSLSAFNIQCHEADAPKPINDDDVPF